MSKTSTNSDKALQKLKESVRALSVDDVEDALTKSTYGDDANTVIKQMDDENKELRENFRILKAEFMDLKEENKKYQREIDDYKKTISKMQYAHQEEVRALEDDLAESKILNKKAGEYSSMLDADSDAFETILELAKIIHGLAKNAESVSLLIKDEVEGHI